MLDWLHQELFTVTLTGFLVRLALLGGVIYLLTRTFWRLRRHYLDQNARIQAQLKREQAFSKLGHQLSAATTPRAAADTIVNIAQELLQWHASTLKLYDPEKQTATSIINYDLIDGKIQEVAPPDSLVSPIMQSVFKEGPKLI